MLYYKLYIYMNIKNQKTFFQDKYKKSIIFFIIYIIYLIYKLYILIISIYLYIYNKSNNQ